MDAAEVGSGSEMGSNKIEANGSDGGVIGAAEENGGSSMGTAGSVAGEAKVNGDVKLSGGEPALVEVESPRGAGSADGSPSTPASKGAGLRKWRRIKRDAAKEGTAAVDFGRALKRGLPILEPVMPLDDHNHKSDGEAESSVASVDVGRAGAAGGDGSPLTASVGALDPELELLASAGGFPVGIGSDSDHSEDRSSKSSTAASAPRQSRAKTIGGKGSGHHVVQQRSLRGKWGGGSDGGKKIRGDRVGGKEISQSSMESDLRSSNAAFAQWGSATANGGREESSVNYDGENSDEAQISQGVEPSHFQDNGEVGRRSGKDDFHDDNIKDDGRDGDENYQPDSEEDPFADSLILLQAAQETLEKELELFENIGKEADSIIYIEETDRSDSSTLESELICLNRKVQILEAELKEESAKAKDRELKVLELEEILNNSQFSEKVVEGSSPRLLQKRHKEMELEVERQFAKALEAEIELLTLRRAAKAWRVMVEDQFALSEEQKSLLESYDQLVVKLNNTEEETVALKRQAGELEGYCRELLGKDGVLTLQNRAFKSSLCFVLQVVLLCVAMWLFLMQLLPLSSEFVPT